MPAPKIFYYCFDNARPKGGNKLIYRHVDILNRNGVEAYVLHTRPGFRLTWFPNQTRVIDRPAGRYIYNPQTDILVLPEDLGVRISAFAVPKVIFNQNLYHGFTTHGKQPPAAYPYLDPKVIAVLSVSDHNAEHLRFAYPGRRVLRIRLGVDAATFTPRPLADKARQVACVAKNMYDVQTLMHVVASRAVQGLNAFTGWRWVLLENMTQAEVAALLHESLLFVFLSATEGLPITPMEALLSGCLTAAYDCGGLCEYLPARFRFPPHDILAVARWMEEVARAHPDGLGEWESVCRAGREQALQFSLEREEESVLAAWSEILGRPVR